MRKRITKPKRINLDLLYPVASATPDEIKLDSQYECYDELFDRKYDVDSYGEYDDFDSEEEYINHEHKKVIPDGESAFFSVIKNGEDW